MYETYMGWLVGEVGKQRVLNTKSVFPFADPLINSPLSSGRVCYRCAAFLVFEAVPNRPSYMDTGQCPRNVFSGRWLTPSTAVRVWWLGVFGARIMDVYCDSQLGNAVVN